MFNYEQEERVAIKMDSHIPEHLAIQQTKKETETPEAIQKLNAFREKHRMIEAEKKAKHIRKFNYE